MKKVDIAIPVYYGNLPEIEKSLKKQLEFYKNNLKEYNWEIILAINGPDKGILKFANEMMKTYGGVRFTYTPIAGKGAGIKKCWKDSNADIVVYMDVDLSTGIEKLPELIKSVDAEYDLSLGSKYLPGSKIRRVKERAFFSRIYHTIITRYILGIKTSDVHCGFKAIKRESFNIIFPLLKDEQWFFDTELMFFATKSNFKIKEIPVIWTDSNSPSGVKIYRTMIKFVFKIIELKSRCLFNRGSNL
ncbi:glycosyltransferase [Candidatus Woesearchaeota archaeon]|nr:glycosyltransferase [Candidatus Woesearchaeota archaeon]